MNKNKKKLVGVVVLCVLGIMLSIGLVVWVYNQKGFGISGFGASSGGGQKKYVSWASKVVIDPAKGYRVVEVVDGDTIKVLIDGHEITVRLLGINTPEVLDPRKPVECYGPEASEETKSLLIGKSVLLVLNPNYERIDKYGRLLVYVRLMQSPDELPAATSSELFVNEFLIKEGYAREYTFNEKNPYQYQSLFKLDESRAKGAKKGLWGKCTVA
jgi:micrococcal nuclease